jgi:hypothetical protein
MEVCIVTSRLSSFVNFPIPSAFQIGKWTNYAHDGKSDNGRTPKTKTAVVVDLEETTPATAISTPVVTTVIADPITTTFATTTTTST